MPRKSKLQKPKVATSMTEEKAAIPVRLPLVMEEREELIKLLNNPVFLKAWNNAELEKPPVFPGGIVPDGPAADSRDAKALARIQGWELHKAALIKQTLEIVPKKAIPTEQFPATGSLEAEVQRNLKSR